MKQRAEDTTTWLCCHASPAIIHISEPMVQRNSCESRKALYAKSFLLDFRVKESTIAVMKIGPIFQA